MHGMFAVYPPGSSRYPYCRKSWPYGGPRAMRHCAAGLSVQLKLRSKRSVAATFAALLARVVASHRPSAERVGLEKRRPASTSSSVAFSRRTVRLSRAHAAAPAVPPRRPANPSSPLPRDGLGLNRNRHAVDSWDRGLVRHTHNQGVQGTKSTQHKGDCRKKRAMCAVGRNMAARVSPTGNGRNVDLKSTYQVLVSPSPEARVDR